MSYSIRRIDAIQPDVVKLFKILGASVTHLHGVGNGCPDLCVGYRRGCYMVEVKSGAKKKLTTDQLIWHNAWKGSVDIIRSINDVELLILKWSSR